ncbi:hypothetical protein ACLQ26_23150 [Micromonospora sp. DT43]|uniref:hypothetical protein n=1 Tax=Micromonospora sp. DT43 TaxID=3393440 RepID=UPI003CF91BF2
MDVKRFGITAIDEPDGGLVAALINHEWFGDNYATGPEPGGDPDRHGPYWRERITPDCYDPIDPELAERRLRFWSEQFAPVPEHLTAELRQEVYQPLRAADGIYLLRDIGPDAFHDWGGVHNEFHEFLLVDRTNQTVVQIVAADD